MKRSISLTAVIGSILVLLVVTAAALWTASGTRTAADHAAFAVSEFYLEELAGRRSEIVTSFLETKAQQMERAVSLLNPKILESQETLRKYIGNVEAIQGMGLFALVDEDNVVYTEYSTYNGGSRYSFLSGPDSEKRTITTSSIYGAGKQICLSIPVRNQSFQGKKLKNCFIEIEMDDIVSILAFSAKESGTDFSLYYRNGANLTGLDFGDLSRNGNLIQEMQQYLPETEWQDFSTRFQAGESGEVTFSRAGKKQILYFKSIPETGWMITVLIPESLISGKVNSVRNQMMTRSTIQVVITILSLVIFFLVLSSMSKRGAKKLLDQERRIAVRDSLTGVGNQYAYAQKEEAVDAAIHNGTAEPFALVVFDLNGLKNVNDTKGHTEGDLMIRKACRLICELYDHSPVFRIGGDEFVAFLQGADYVRREELLAELSRKVEENRASGDVVIAAGMADYETADSQMRDTFRRADKRMYERKKQLKSK